MVAGVEHLLQRRVEQLRQPLATLPFGARQGRPATVDIGAIGLGETVRRADLAGVPATALTIAAGVQGRQHPLTEARRFLQHLHGE